MSKPKDHWEELFNSKFLRWFDLDGPLILTIKSVDKQELTLPGGATEVQPVLSFQESFKPLVLNKTNCKSVVKQHGKKPSMWAGKRIELFPTQTKFGRDTVDCIRVREPSSQQQPQKSSGNRERVLGLHAYVKADKPYLEDFKHFAEWVSDVLNRPVAVTELGKVTDADLATLQAAAKDLVETSS